MKAKALELHGRVEAVLVANQFNVLASTPVPKIQVIQAYGVKGDNHAGVRLADVRETELLGFGMQKGIEIANHREFSATSIEELAKIARLMKLPGSITNGSLGENIIFSGIPRLTVLPPGTMLFFQKSDTVKRTAVLVIWGENIPCIGPGEVIQQEHLGIAKLASRFPKAAWKRRGIVGSIYCSGFIHEGDTVVVKISEQRRYRVQA